VCQHVFLRRVRARELAVGRDDVEMDEAARTADVSVGRVVGSPCRAGLAGTGQHCRGGDGSAPGVLLSQSGTGRPVLGRFGANGDERMRLPPGLRAPLCLTRGSDHNRGGCLINPLTEVGER
jgi:hypothetical protein